MKKMIISIVLCFAVLFTASFALNETAYQNWNDAHIWLMETLLPGVTEDFPDGAQEGITECVRIPYDGEDANIRDIHKGENGFVIQTATQGYAGEIVMSIGVAKDGRVTGLVVEEAHETYGLGSRILTDHVFLAQFLNKSGNFEIATQGADAFSGATAAAEPEGETIQVDGITGATVSSKAVARSVNSAVAYVTGADAVSSATTWGG